MLAASEPPAFPPLEIHAIVGKAEQRLVQAAASLLSECLESATGAPAPITVTLDDAVRSDFWNAVPAPIPEAIRNERLIPEHARDPRTFLHQKKKRIVVTSLLGDVRLPAMRHRSDGYRFFPRADWKRGWAPAQRAWVAEHCVEEPAIGVAEAAGHWRALCTRLLEDAGANVFVLNVFRHVPGKAQGGVESTGALRERILQFDLMAGEVSHDTGVNVVDLDRALSQPGARALRTDYRLRGPGAVSAGADALLSVLFRAGLDDFFPAEIQTKATAHFETRRLTIDWHHLQSYSDAVRLVMVEIAERFMKGFPAGTEGPRIASKFLRRKAVTLDLLLPPGRLGSHRGFAASIREAAARYDDLIQAITTGDSAGQRQALQRAQQALDTFHRDVKALDSSRPRGGGGDGPAPSRAGAGPAPPTPPTHR